MMIFLIILACLLWLGAFLALPKRIILGPALSFCALLVLSFAKKDGYSIFHLTGGMQLSWLVITLLVMMIIMMQNPAVRQQSRGVVYMEVGAIAGLAIGLLGCTFTTNLNLLYALAIIGIAAGIFLGFLMFTNTPDGRDVNLPSGRFFKYLLAKGFPVLVTAAQLSVPAVILIAATGN
ncbi:MAG: hypothetical protein K2H35_07345 [Muribaculaceae bacterium]|nr:hypothetical protein [Muribaculaceae bacterium]MDE6558303.1 hypothetical protein [Muribaculaceae bacterium]